MITQEEKESLIQYLNNALIESVGSRNDTTEQKLSTLVTWVADLSSNVAQGNLLDINNY